MKRCHSIHAFCGWGLAFLMSAATACAQQPEGDHVHTLELLKKITLAQGSSGNEGDIRAIVRATVGKGVALQETPKGDLVARLQGTEDGPVILLTAHMDEVGFQVRAITPDGFLLLAPLGNWYAESMADHLVTVRTSQGILTGVVGVRPPHLMSPADKTTAPGVKAMYIDIGASSAAQARKWGVQLGDRVVPQSGFLQLGKAGRYISKAWDDRVGCALLAQLTRQFATRPHPNTIYVAWTTGEEFGRSNATVEMPGLKPDFVIVMEVGITTDTPDAKAGEQQEKLGDGPALDLYDGSISTAPAVRDWFTAQAHAAGIPLQYTTIQQEGSGVGVENSSYLFRAPSTALLVPLRYAHSPRGVIDIHDYIQARELLAYVLGNLNHSALRQMTGAE